MNDTFIEKIVSRRKTGKDYLKVFGLLIASFFIILVLMVFGGYIGFLVPLILVGVVYGLWFFISGMNREYEYIITNGEIDIDMIIAKRRRKRIFSGRVRDFELVAKVDGDEYGQARKGKHELVDCASHPESSDAWFILTDYKGQRVVVLFEPDQRMLEIMKRYNPSKVKYNKFGS